MADPIKTNINNGSLQAGTCRFADETATLAATTTYKAGTILARDSVSKKLVPYVKGGSTNENGIPKAVLNEALTTTSSGDYKVRPILGGVVNFSYLVIHADGTNANIDAPVLDQLRDYGIESEVTAQLSKYDN